MRYKIRFFYLNTNEEALLVSEVFESKEAAETAIEGLKGSNPGKYEYAKFPIK